MSRLHKPGVLLLCCFLHGLIFASALNASSVGDIEAQDSQFVQLRASLPSYSQPIQPYSLWTNTEDYYNLPKPRQRRPSRLLRLLGPHFDPFWMSIDHPPESHGVWISDRDQESKVGKRFELGASLQLKQAREATRLELHREAAGLDLSSLPSDAAGSIRDWLVESATCGLRYQWVDLGKAFWPRWLRHTDCERAEVTHTCSFPSGMMCKRAHITPIKILAWHCQELPPRTDNLTSSKDHGALKVKQLCRWRLVSYPVVTGCVCACK